MLVFARAVQIGCKPMPHAVQVEGPTGTVWRQFKRVTSLVYRVAVRKISHKSRKSKTRRIKRRANKEHGELSQIGVRCKIDVERMDTARVGKLLILLECRNGTLRRHAAANLVDQSRAALDDDAHNLKALGESPRGHHKSQAISSSRSSPSRTVGRGQHACRPPPPSTRVLRYSSSRRARDVRCPCTRWTSSTSSMWSRPSSRKTRTSSTRPCARPRSW